MWHGFTSSLSLSSYLHKEHVSCRYHNSYVYIFQNQKNPKPINSVPRSSISLWARTNPDYPPKISPQFPAWPSLAQTQLYILIFVSISEVAAYGNRGLILLKLLRSLMAVLKGKYIKFPGRTWSTFKLSKIVMAFLLALGISMFIAFRFFSPTESSHSNLLHRLASVQHRAVHRYLAMLISGIKWFWFWFLILEPNPHFLLQWWIGEERGSMGWVHFMGA